MLKFIIKRLNKTPLKDINGKDIYIGNRVKFFSGDNLKDPFSFWVEGTVTKCISLTRSDIYIREDNTKGNDGHWNFYGRNKLEVIDEK